MFMRKLIVTALFFILIIPVTSADSISFVHLPDTVAQNHNFNTTIQVLLSSGHEYRVILIIGDVQVITNTFNISTKPANGIFNFEISMHNTGVFNAYAKLERDGVVISQDQGVITVVDIKDILQDIDSLKSQVTTIELEIDQLQSQINENTARIDELSENVSSISSELAKVEEDLINLTNRVSGIEGELNDVWTEISSLYDSLSLLNGRLSSIEDRVTTLEQTMRDLQATVSDIQGWIAETEITLEELKINDSDLAASINSLKRDLQDLQDMHNMDIAQIQNRLDNIDVTLLDIQSQLASLCEYVNESDRQIIEQHLNDVRLLRDDIDSKYDELNSAVDSLRQSLDQVNERVNRVDRDLKTVSSLTGKIEYAFTRTFRVNTIEEAVDKIEESLNTLYMRLDNLSRRSNESHRELNESIIEIRATLNNITLKIQSVKQGLEELQTDFKEYMNSTDEKIAKLNNKIEELENENKQLRRLVNELLKPQHITLSRSDNDLLVKVTTYDDVPVAGAMITVTTSNVTVTGVTDKNGTFEFNMEEKGILGGEKVTITSQRFGYANSTLETTIPTQPKQSVPGFGAILVVVCVAGGLLVRLRRM